MAPRRARKKPTRRGIDNGPRCPSPLRPARPKRRRAPCPEGPGRVGPPKRVGLGAGWGAIPGAFLAPGLLWPSGAGLVRPALRRTPPRTHRIAGAQKPPAKYQSGPAQPARPDSGCGGTEHPSPRAAPAGTAVLHRPRVRGSAGKSGPTVARKPPQLPPLPLRKATLRPPFGPCPPAGSPLR